MADAKHGTMWPWLNAPDTQKLEMQFRGIAAGAHGPRLSVKCSACKSVQKLLKSHIYKFAAG